MSRLETELEGQVEVIRLDVFTAAGQEAIRRYGIRGLPTLLVIDGCGERAAAFAGVPNPTRVRESVLSVPVCDPEAGAN